MSNSSEMHGSFVNNGESGQMAWTVRMGQILCVCVLFWFRQPQQRELMFRNKNEDEIIGLFCILNNVEKWETT